MKSNRCRIGILAAAISDARGLYQFQPLYTTPTTSKNNRFVANYIHDNQQRMNDGDAFYELSASPGTVFSKNYLKAPAHSAGSNFDTYSDEGTRYVTFSQNVFDGWGEWANLNCTDVNETGNITYTGNWGATAGISGQAGCSASTRSCPASYVNSGPTYAGNPTNVSVPSLVSTWTAGNCGDIVANSTEPTSAAAAQAVVNGRDSRRPSPTSRTRPDRAGGRRAKATPRSGRAQGDDVAVGGGGPVDGDGHRITSHSGGGIRNDQWGVERRIACRHLFQEDLC